MDFISYGNQNIKEEDIEAVVSVLRSDYLTQGPSITKFENSICHYTNSKYGIAVNSATSGLHIAYLALGIGKGDYVWTTPNTFVSTANAALFCGANIDFVDIDSKTYNLCPVKLLEKLEQAKKKNKLPKLVVPVHFGGQSCEMKEIYKLSKQYGFSIVEDASHAIGARYCNEPIGNCRYSDITVFSFHPVKIITTGEGGIAVTNNPDLSNKMRLLSSHCTTRDENLMKTKSHGPWYYQQIGLGFNFRMTDIQATLGLSQVNHLDEFIEARHQHINKYNEQLENLPVVIPYQSSSTHSSFHLYPILVKNRKEVYNYLHSKKIGAGVHYIPVHLQPYYRSLGFKEGDFPNSEAYYQEELSLPLFPHLKNDQIEYIIQSLKEAIL